LGHLAKREVRALARAAGLPNHDRRDSTGICFIGERRFKDFLARFLPAQPGEIRALDDDQPLGRHDGLMYYTLGQRHGLGLGGPGKPWYVADKDLARNVLYVVQGHDHPALLSRELVASEVHWIAGTAPPFPLACHAKIRYRQAEQPCVVEPEEGGRLRVRFRVPQWAVTPGQSVVFYEGEVCLGGAVIESRVPLVAGARTAHAPVVVVAADAGTPAIA
jgi:tRNA-specific 2-thiouridylase